MRDGETPAPARVTGGAAHLARALWAGSRRDLVLTVALSAAASATQGAAALLLVPLLRAAGVDVAGGGAPLGRVTRAVDGALAAVGAPRSLGAVLGAYVLVAALQAGVGAAARVRAERLDQEFVRRLRDRLYRAVTRAEWVVVARARGSDITHALTGEADRVGIAVAQVALLVNRVLTGLVYVALAALVSPAMTLLAAACGAVLLLTTRAWTRQAHRDGERLSEAGAALQAAAQEHVAGLKTARALGAEDRAAAHFARVGAGAAGLAVATTRRRAAAWAAFDVGAAVALAVLLYAALRVLALPTGAVLVLLVLFGRVVPVFSGVQQGWQEFVHALPAYARVAGMAERFEQAAEPAEALGAEAPSLRHELRLDVVHFAYPGRGAPVLSGVSLVVPAGQITALVGPSGVGKSTIADLVLGLLRPDAGAVRVDGVALTPERARAWRRRVGYVAQDVFLLHDTVRANLAWAAPNTDEAAMWESLRAADVAEVIRRLPRGLDTVVGDRGAVLSGGERQRLALARALLRKPVLLVLDEATSAVDPASDERIMDAVARLRGAVTALVITHRASTARHADQVSTVVAGYSAPVVLSRSGAFQVVGG